MDPITLDIQNQIATITLNRPQAYNSVNKVLALSLQNSLDDLEANQDIRVIVITGSGKAFCAGQDLVEISTPELNPGLKNILEKHYAPIITKIRNSRLPIIAAVNGVAAGAGANIALACDIVVATASSSFIQAFSAIGLIPDSAGTFFLPRLIGFQKAMGISMLGDKVSAPDAEKMGMIYRCVDDDLFDEEVKRITEKVAHLPTRALTFTKHAFNQSLTNNLEEQLAVENEYQIKASETEDFAEGLDAFINKRKPYFKGN